mmetsp:Transcript_22492/g.33227  ORF Transcript_22492/g.33227 Transcript_22492/m.33227 type:complete len:84 (+) Transcript_22492:1525-1776(+)
MVVAKGKGRLRTWLWSDPNTSTTTTTPTTWTTTKADLKVPQRIVFGPRNKNNANTQLVDNRCNLCFEEEFYQLQRIETSPTSS